MTIVTLIIWIIIAYLILRLISATNKVVEIRGHWNHFFDNVQFSSQDFYTAIETTVRAKEIINLQTSRIKYAEGNLLSANREYLRISRGLLVFDICMAPFAKGFFISSWQGDLPNFMKSLLTSIPYIGTAIEGAIYRKTYYQLDTEEMYMKAVHSSVLEAIDQITNQHGVRSLTPEERLYKKPN